MPMHPRKTILIAWIVFGVLELALIGVAAWIFMENDKTVVENVAHARSVRDLELKLISYDKIRKENDELGNQGDRLAAHFTREDTVVEFLRSVETAATESGVSLTISLYDIKPAATSKKEKEKQKKEDKNAEKPLVFLLETKSSFSAFSTFLIKLENLSKYTDVKKVDVAHETVKEQVKRTTGEGEEQVTVTKEFAHGKIVIIAQ